MSELSYGWREIHVKVPVSFMSERDQEDLVADWVRKQFATVENKSESLGVRRAAALRLSNFREWLVDMNLDVQEGQANGQHG